MIFFNKFSNKINLNLAIIIITIFLVIIFASSQYRSTVTKNINNIFTETIKVKSYIYKLERDQHYFKSYKKERYLDNFQSHFQKLLISLDNLDKKFKQFENHEKTIRFLKVHLLEYRKGFKDFINWKIKIEEKKGLQYQFDFAKENFLKITKTNKKFYLDSKFLALELIVKDFLLSYNLKESKKFTAKYVDLKRNILYENGLNQAQRDKLIVYLNIYQKAFSKMIEIATTIGISLNIGIIGDIQIEIKKSQSYIDSLIKNAEKLRTKKLYKIERIVLILNSVLSLSIFLIIFIIFRKIINSTKYLNIATQELRISAKANHIQIKNSFMFKNIIQNLNNFFDNQTGMLNEYKNQHIRTIKLTDEINEKILNDRKNIRKIYTHLSNGDQYLNFLNSQLPKIQNNIVKQNETILLVKDSITQEMTTALNLQYYIARYEEEKNSILVDFEHFHNFLVDNSLEKIESLEIISESLKLLSVNSAIESSKVGKDGENISIIADDVRKVEKLIILEILKLKQSSLEQMKFLDDLKSNIANPSTPILEIKIYSQKLERHLKVIENNINKIMSSAKSSQNDINSILISSETNLTEIRTAFELSEASVNNTGNSNYIAIKLQEIYGKKS